MSLVPKHIKQLSPYKPGKTIESVKRKYNIKHIVKLASNENPLGPSKKALDAVSDILFNSHRYPDASGLILREKLANSFDVKIDNVILGSGSEGIMSSIMRTFLKEKDELISSENSFIGFRVLANASGKKTNWIPKKSFRYDLKAIAEKINRNTKIIYIANPDNPTGTYITKDEFDSFMSNVPDRVLVVLDEAYFEYANHIEDYPDSMFYRYDNVITLRTFSKVYGLAGFRVGYGFAHQDLIGNLMKVKLPFEPSSSSQVAAIAALDDLNHLDKTIALNKKEMIRVCQFLKDNKFNFIPSVANFVTIVFNSRNDTVNASNFLLKNGVIVRDLIGFGLPCSIRITIGKESENEVFMQKISEYIGNL
ncbi:MAG: histidinol-phosphate transaminase [Candidatus Marinimicrobia bacterium]|nr:histidinol-phosphate transaminase [Candidatus Neomarinimicrobiota bacterium]|tara:strand:- start:29522 stop:30616 length:1095 start_codon:yes stop_codon:yes gene_type:complete